LRASSEYRRRMIGVFVQRGIEAALARSRFMEVNS
jgi:hypothetical protein